MVVGGQSPERMESIYYPLGRNSYLSESAYYIPPGSFGPRYLPPADVVYTSVSAQLSSLD